jgi:DNA-binding transcriptional ArsR family regulator
MVKLKLARTLTVFVLAFVITFSFTALIQRQKDAAFSLTARNSPALAVVNRGAYDLLTFPTLTHYFSALPPFLFPDMIVNDRPTQLPDNSTRTEIYDFIQDNPGVQFRGICSELDLSIGLAEFHLGVLKKAGLISFIRDGRYTRYFEARKFSLKEMGIISLLRHQTARNILKNILSNKEISHCELASHLSITSQGLTWQMNRLKKAGLVQTSKDGIKVQYSLEESYAPILYEALELVKQL